MALQVLFAVSSVATRPQTIVSIISDDHGYFDLGMRGNINVTTPVLDGLFRSGIDLSHHWSFKYCSPSRRSFVTGRWPMHLGELNQLADGIDLRFSTLADKLRAVGWHNVLIGKTHWGTKTSAHLPVNRGWDEHLGYLGGGEAYSTGHECVDEKANCDTYKNVYDLWHNEEPAEQSFVGRYSTDLFTELAVNAIAQHGNGTNTGPRAGQPLWLHLNYQAVHNPYTTPPGWPRPDETAKNYDQLVYYQVLQRMDEGIGNVTSALKEHGLWDDAVVLFFGDNGGANRNNNYPLRCVRAPSYAPAPPLCPTALCALTTHVPCFAMMWHDTMRTVAENISRGRAACARWRHWPAASWSERRQQVLHSTAACILATGFPPSLHLRAPTRQTTRQAAPRRPTSNSSTRSTARMCGRLSRQAALTRGLMACRLCWQALARTTATPQVTTVEPTLAPRPWAAR